MRTRPRPQDIKIHYPLHLSNTIILTHVKANEKANERKKTEKDIQ